MASRRSAVSISSERNGHTGAACTVYLSIVRPPVPGLREERNEEEDMCKMVW